MYHKYSDLAVVLAILHVKALSYDPQWPKAICDNSLPGPGADGPNTAAQRQSLFVHVGQSPRGVGQMGMETCFSLCSLCCGMAIFAAGFVRRRYFAYGQAHSFHRLCYHLRAWLTQSFSGQADLGAVGHHPLRGNDRSFARCHAIGTNGVAGRYYRQHTGCGRCFPLLEENKTFQKDVMKRCF